MKKFLIIALLLAATNVQAEVAPSDAQKIADAQAQAAAAMEQGSKAMKEAQEQSNKAMKDASAQIEAAKQANQGMKANLSPDQQAQLDAAMKQAQKQQEQAAKDSHEAMKNANQALDAAKAQQGVK